MKIDLICPDFAKFREKKNSLLLKNSTFKSQKGRKSIKVLLKELHFQFNTAI